MGEEEKNNNANKIFALELSERFNALFGVDDEITVAVDESNNRIIMHVGREEKAKAIRAILSDSMVCGFEKVEIVVRYDGRTVKIGESDFSKTCELLKAAFWGNPRIYSIETVDFCGTDMNVVTFVKEVVQYKSVINPPFVKVTTTLAQSLAVSLIDLYMTQFVTSEE